MHDRDVKFSVKTDVQVHYTSDQLTGSCHCCHPIQAWSALRSRLKTAKMITAIVAIMTCRAPFLFSNHFTYLGVGFDCSSYRSSSLVVKY